jgi:hypothetical protein
MHAFDEDLALKGTDGRLFTGDISPRWSVNNNPDGGYLMAVMAAALTRVSVKKATPVFTANYVSRSVPGTAEVAIEEITQSTQFSRLEARLVQEGRERIRMLGTFSRELDECFIRRYEATPPEVAPRSECVRIPALPGYTLFEHMDVLLDPACAGWLQDRLVETSEQRGWIAFHDERPHDLFSVLLAVDSFPPAILASQGMLAWVPTIELTVNIRNIPESRWLRGVFRTRFITCGLVEEDGELWDEGGELVAISRQIAQFRKAA